jgi:hypothetical protein
LPRILEPGYDVLVSKGKHGALLLFLIPILFSCTNPKATRAVVVLDEAFVAAYPDLSTAIQEAQSFPGSLAVRPFGTAQVRVLSLSQGAGFALDAVKEAKVRSGGRIVLVTSPLIASALVQGDAWRGEPPLVVPEWPNKAVAGLSAVKTDPIPAYSAAGAAFGAYIAALAGDGSSPLCGILFSEGPGRPRAALEAFARAFDRSSGGRRLLVRELGSRAGAQDEKIGDSLSETPITDASLREKSGVIGPEEAVKEMLGSDIRALFIGLGSETVTAINSAIRPALALAAEYTEPLPPESVVFRIVPDRRAIVGAIAREVSSFKEREAGLGTIVSVPARIEIEKRAAGFRAGGRSLDFYIREAMKKQAR